MQIQAWAALAAGEPLEPFTYEAEPGPGEVLVAVTHCGLCHSDVHLADGDWGEVFPLVPGHEVVGTVVCGGSLPPGARVGIGWHRGSCGACEHCDDGEEVYCEGNEATCVGNYGGFASHVIAQERFVIPIPDGLDSAIAAPLLCGGATVFTPLQRYARAGMTVGVLGVGGLGHLAIRFAAAMGCTVVALSRSPEKEAAARRFGAHDFLAGVPAKRSLDLLLNTAPVAPRMPGYIAALRPKGVFVQVGATSEPLVLSAGALIACDRAVAGSAVAHPAVLHQMLSFAAEHGVGAEIQRLPMERCNEALAITRENRARYRVVLERSSGEVVG